MGSPERQDCPNCSDLDTAQSSFLFFRHAHCVRVPLESPSNHGLGETLVHYHLRQIRSIIHRYIGVPFTPGQTRTSHIVEIWLQLDATNILAYMTLELPIDLLLDAVNAVMSLGSKGFSLHSNGHPLRPNTALRDYRLGRHDTISICPQRCVPTS